MVSSINRATLMVGALVFLVATLLVPAMTADAEPARTLAPTGSALGPIMLIVLAVLLIGGVAFLIVGRRRAKNAAAVEPEDTSPPGN